MESVPFNIRGTCVSSDEELFANIAHALTLGLPEISEPEAAHSIPVAIVGSGPSLRSELNALEQIYFRGHVCAVRDAHDFLIADHIYPTYALSVDPLESAAKCFANPRKGVGYLIASQSHRKMFENLEGMEVMLWHAYMQKDQKLPKNRMLISGASTSGIRAIFVMWVLGYRDFHLFGMDSCLENGKLRVNGDLPKPGDEIREIQIEPNGEKFYCNPGMALQAQSFQDCYMLLPDAKFTGYGHGLIQALIKKREAEDKEFRSNPPIDQNGSVSFIHSGDMKTASYRYRSMIPAMELDGKINDLQCSTLVFSKPRPEDLIEMGRARHRGQRIIVDFCDDHFNWTHYQEALRYADEATCPTEAMREIIRNVPHFGRDAMVIPDYYEFPVAKPHCHGVNLLWFGHAVNKMSLSRLLDSGALNGYPLRVVSNFGGTIPWSYETMLEEFKRADIVVLPATERYKSANRAVESIRQGCFVIAEPHPAWDDIPGIYIGDIKEGLEWLKRQPITEVNRRISTAQKYVTGKYSPKIITAMWKNLIQSPITSDAAKSTGPDGPTLMLHPGLISNRTSETLARFNLD